MKNFLLGMVFGIVVSAVGFSGLAAMADRGVQHLRQGSQLLVTPN